MDAPNVKMSIFGSRRPWNKKLNTFHHLLFQPYSINWFFMVNLLITFFFCVLTFVILNQTSEVVMMSHQRLGIPWWPTHIEGARKADYHFRNHPIARLTLNLVSILPALRTSISTYVAVGKVYGRLGCQFANTWWDKRCISFLYSSYF